MLLFCFIVGKWELYDDGTIRNKKAPDLAIGSNADGTAPILVHATATQERLIFKDVLQLAGNAATTAPGTKPQL